MNADITSQTASIVFRETLEAALVLAILASFIKNLEPSHHPKAGLRSLFLGVIGGLLLSLMVGFGLVQTSSQLNGDSLTLFQAAMGGICALLMLQMIWWMNRTAAGLKKEIYAKTSALWENRGWIGISLVAALAVAREGAETVLFIYGLTNGSTGLWPSVATGTSVGLACAITIAWLLQRGLQLIPLKWIFLFSSMALSWTAFQVGSKNLETLFDLGMVTDASLIIAKSALALAACWVVVERPILYPILARMRRANVKTC